MMRWWYKLSTRVHLGLLRESTDRLRRNVEGNTRRMDNLEVRMGTMLSRVDSTNALVQQMHTRMHAADDAEAPMRHVAIQPGGTVVITPAMQPCRVFCAPTQTPAMPPLPSSLPDSRSPAADHEGAAPAEPPPAG